MKYWLHSPLFAAVLLMLSGCGSSGSLQKDTAAASEEREQKVPLSRYEKAFNPSDYDVEILEIQRQHVIELERAAAEHRQDSVIVESTFTQGYRIQIFATGSIDEANAMRMTAAQRVTEDSLYVVYDSPTYKVRVGDFPTRSEANQKLAAIVAQGFSDAWVVGDRIVQRKLVRVPSQPSPKNN
ncbi:MAG: SPOR domain-containing protein [Ignavibacteriales bacterium]|nr:SPOR domain-containing protein [Ignavibacteriales bacterium]